MAYAVSQLIVIRLIRKLSTYCFNTIDLQTQNVNIAEVLAGRGAPGASSSTLGHEQTGAWVPARVQQAPLVPDASGYIPVQDTPMEIPDIPQDQIWAELGPPLSSQNGQVPEQDGPIPILAPEAAPAQAQPQSTPGDPSEGGFYFLTNYGEILGSESDLGGMGEPGPSMPPETSANS